MILFRVIILNMPGKLDCKVVGCLLFLPVLALEVRELTVSIVEQEELDQLSLGDLLGVYWIEHSNNALESFIIAAP